MSDLTGAVVKSYDHLTTPRGLFKYVIRFKDGRRLTIESKTPLMIYQHEARHERP